MTGEDGDGGRDYILVDAREGKAGRHAQETGVWVWPSPP